MIQKFSALCLVLFLSSFTFKSISENALTSNLEITEESARDLFLKVDENSIDSTALYIALTGYLNIQKSVDVNPERLVVIDFSKPSTENRFFLINPKTGRVLHQSVVAHGQNSGELFAQNFSNRPGSHQSSLGFYRVAEPYVGKHGKSLRLDGLEKGMNDRARERAIVIHSANYANPSFAVSNGYLGRSFGCPALPENNYNWIVNEIENGTLLFIYHPTKYAKVKSNWV